MTRRARVVGTALALVLATSLACASQPAGSNPALSPGPLSINAPSAAPSTPSQAAVASPGVRVPVVTPSGEPGTATAAARAAASPTPAPSATRGRASGTALDVLLNSTDVEGRLIAQRGDWRAGRFSRTLTFAGEANTTVVLDEDAHILDQPGTKWLLTVVQPPLPGMPTLATASIFFNLGKDAAVTGVVYYSGRLGVQLSFETVQGVGVPISTVVRLAQLSASRLPPEAVAPGVPERGPAAPVAAASALAIRLMRYDGQDYTEAQGTRFTEADELALFEASAGQPVGLGIFFWSNSQGQYVQFEARYAPAAGEAQPIVIANLPPGEYVADGVIFSGEDLLDFSVAGSLAFTLAP